MPRKLSEFENILYVYEYEYFILADGNYKR